MELTIGQIVDQLITNNIKCWFAIEEIHSFGSIDDVSKLDRESLERIARASIKTHELNNKRSKLVAALDASIAQAVASGFIEKYTDEKTYGS